MFKVAAHTFANNPEMPTNGPQSDVSPALRADDEERTVLVCMIAQLCDPTDTKPDLLPSVLQQVGPADCLDTLHRDCFAEIIKLRQTDSFTISRLVTGLVDRGHSDDVVRQYVRGLQDDYPRSATIDYFCKAVADASARRQAIAASERTIRAACDKSQSRAEVTELAEQPARILRGVDRAAHRSTWETFNDWAAGVVSREKPKLYDVAAIGGALREFQLGAGLVTMIGAPPAAGKTMLVAQVSFDTLRLPGQSHLKLLFANVEMSQHAILNRQLARLTGIGHSWIYRREYDVDATPRIEAGIEILRDTIKRVEFMRPPFTLERLVSEAECFGADVVVADYAQRFAPERAVDQRAQANAAMDACRRVADHGRAVVVVSAVSRQRGKNGSSYESGSLGLASFRESSELEYGADTAYLLLRDEQDNKAVTLKCVKNRHGQVGEIKLSFDGSRQQFTDTPLGQEWEP